MTDDEERQEQLDEGARLFDHVVQEGLIAGRYLLVSDPDNPDNPRLHPGPYFDLPPGDECSDLMSWAITQIDEQARNGLTK